MKERYEGLREKQKNIRQGKQYISLKDARKNRFVYNAEQTQTTLPVKTEVVIKGLPAEILVPYIDWTFFFHAWELRGKFPAILNDPLKGKEALKLYNDANQMLERISSGNMLEINGIASLFPAVSSGDDVIIYNNYEREREVARFHFLRNQEKKEENMPNLCLADFIAPAETGITDTMGLFAVTAGKGIEPWVKSFEDDNDDYSSIMLKILADRLAEAFAEFLHEKVRKEYWGYAKDEELSLPELLKESYQGIRPAPGYPACPEHSEKVTLFEVLDAPEKAGITLTENFMMQPAASVSGYYFAHPESRYFNLGRILDDQVEDYAKRKKLGLDQTRKLLSSSLA
jgi:5-methyltetrahydrofolate--homocysteine methyltransferase